MDNRLTHKASVNEFSCLRRMLLIGKPMIVRKLMTGLVAVVFVNLCCVVSLQAQSNDLQSLLDLYPETPAGTTAESSEQRVVYTASAKSKIDLVDSSQPFTVIRTVGQWEYVRFKEPTVPVWVSQDYIRVSSGLATVRPARLNARLRPSTQAPILIGLNRGFTSEILDSKNGFAKIKAPASLVVTLVRGAQNRDLPKKSIPSIKPNTNDPLSVAGQTGQTSSTGQKSSTRWTNSNLKRSFEGTAVSDKNSAIQSSSDRDNLSSVGPDSSESIASEIKGERESEIDVITQTPASIEPPSNSAMPSLTEQGHLIAPGDSISLFVFGEADLSASNIHVPQSGNVSLPLIGTVPVAGKTIFEVADQVRNILSQGYVRNPRVSVSIFSYRPIFIRGAIRSVGSFPYSEGLTVSKAIAIAGGTKNSAQTNGISVMRDGQVIETGLSVDSQYAIASGDVLSVAEELGVSDDAALFIYLHGEVASSGEYLFRRGLTVEKAIVLAGGFTLRGSKKKVSITRYNGIAANEEPVKMRSVKLHTQIEPGDVISVGARWF